MLSQPYTRTQPYKLVHHHNTMTKRSCIVCGDPIRARNFGQRAPENKVNLCKRHLRSKLTLERAK
jgi:hypothetical protein